ncbi:MAG: DUF2459 domain-containing protein [Caulobacteraceae bacterium]
MRSGRLSAALRACLILTAAGICSFAILAALTNRPGDPALYPPSPGARTETVYVVVEGIHADLVLPRSALRRTSRVAARAVRALGPGEWIAVGWGDERFYKETGLSPARMLDALRCLFWPANTRTIVRVDVLAAPPPQGLVHASWVRLVLSEEGFRRLATRLDRAFLAPEGTPQLTPPAPWDATGRYFRSSERFHFRHLCTHWIADLLDAAGVPTVTALDTAPPGLIFDLGRHADERP